MSLASFASALKWKQWHLPSRHNFDNEIKSSTLEKCASLALLSPD